MSENEISNIFEHTVYHSRGEVTNRVLITGTGDNLIFIPGWASTPYTWRKFIPVLSQSFSVHYYETREKSETVLHNNSPGYSVQVMSDDIADYIDTVDGAYYLISVSTGSVIFINSWDIITNKPESMALISPSRRVEMPWWFNLLPYVPTTALELACKPVVWGLKHCPSLLDKHRANGMLRAIESTNMSLLQRSIKALSKVYLPRQKIENIDIPTLIVAATEESLHSTDEALQVADLTSCSELTYVSTFTHSHSSSTADNISSWLIEQSPHL